MSGPIFSFGIELSGITCTKQGGGNCDAILSSLVNETLFHYVDGFMEDYLFFDEHTLAGLMSNTSVSFGLSQKGMTTDYSSNIRVAMVGLGVGFGLSAGDTGFQSLLEQDYNALADTFSGGVSGNLEIPGVGLGVGASGMVGLPLKLLRLPKLIFIDPNKITLFGGGMYAPYTYNLDANSKVEFQYLSYSGHAQYKLFRKRDIGFSGLRWGGIDLTSGLEHNSMKLLYSSNNAITPSGLETITDGTNTLEVLPLGEMGNMANVQITGDAEFGVELSSTSVPVELSTSFRFLYFITFFAGGAVDFNIGRSLIIMEPSLGISGTLLGGDPFAPVSEATISSDAKIDFTSEGSPELITFRGFGGVQLNLTIIKLVANVSFMPSPQAFGANVAVRVAF